MNNKEQMKIPSLKDIMSYTPRVNFGEPLQFEGDCQATINKDFSVTWVEDGYKVQIKGFPTAQDAHQFCMFADFDERDNHYLATTGAGYKLTWIPL